MPYQKRFNGYCYPLGKYNSNIQQKNNQDTYQFLVKLIFNIVLFCGNLDMV